MDYVPQRIASTRSWMTARLLLAATAFTIVASFGSAESTYAQRIVEVDGPGDGETTYMMQSPRPLGDNVMVRALGVRGRDGQVRYALMVRNVTEGAAVTLMANSEPVEVLRTDVTTRTPRTLSVYISPSGLLTLAHAASATISIGGNQYPFPGEVKASLTTIHEKTH